VALTCAALSYVAAMTRAIAPAETATADLGMVALLSWIGVLLAADDGVLDEDRLTTLLRRMVAAGGVLAALGLAQFVTGTTWVDRISVPGLAANQALTLVGSRGDFTRPSGTALHPIEFGAVLTMLLPVAVNLALGDRTRSALRRWLPVGLIASAVVLSISRSALICAAVGMLVIAWRWAPQVQVRAGFATVGLMGVFFVTVPGLIGTLTGMFTSLGSDTSTLSRVDSYGTAAMFIERSPVIGRGLSTFLPSYRILDNQYLLLLIEVGVLGTVAFALLMVAGIRAGLAARRWSTQTASALQAQSLAAAVAAGATGLAFYDGFSFPMASGTLFLMLGLSGAQLRLASTRVSTR
jgi:O-antigen ligase